ncbi:MAG: hypothetical protein LBT65_00550 [Synergistaceae bacterium]|nr:hypothetical protein [Synergistaceae bacterium]
MRRKTAGILRVLAAMGILACSFSGAGAFYIPVEPGLRGMGSANVLAIEADLRALEEAALLFRSEDSAGAEAMAHNVNNIALLAGYMDVPGRFEDASRYGFIADARGWWLGAVVTDSDVMRVSAAEAAKNRNWLGSPDTATPPEGTVFEIKDSVVWKLMR